MTRSRRQTGIWLGAGTALLVGVLALTLGGADRRAEAGVAERPNVVVIMTDDQDLASMRVMPRTRKLLGDKGTTFTNSLASNPICCPSRATFLSGLYSHNTGILRNSPPNGGFVDFDDSNTLPVWLQGAGYHTGLIGKYMNGYGFSDPTYIPPGWSEWYGAVDPSTYRMYGYTLNENGETVTYGEYATPDPALYQTDVYAQKAADFIVQAPEEKPFFLEVAPLAPHTEVFNSQGDDDPPIPNFPNPRPAPRDVGVFATENLSRTPAFNEENVSDKPAAIRARPLMTSGRIAMTKNRNRSRLESLLAVDDMVAKIVRTLRETGELDNTVILYTSDNGFELGEHRIPNGKQQPYEESLRVPLLIRGPGVPRGEAREALAANIDLAPTIADIAGTRPGHSVDGESLLPAIEDPDRRKGRAIVIENWCQTNEECFDPEVPRYRGVRTDRFTFVRHPNGELELYDLARDPYQLKSRHGSDSYGRQRRALTDLLDEIEGCRGRACRVAPEVKLDLEFNRGRRPGGGACAKSGVAVKPAGADGRRALDATLHLPGGVEVADDSRPIRFKVGLGELKQVRNTRLRAEVTVLDGRVRAATKAVPRPC